jgi:hypothetical protein
MRSYLKRMLMAVAAIMITSIYMLIYPGMNAQAKEYGMVPYKDNANHTDAGYAKNKEESPFYPSRASTNGEKITTDLFDQPEVCGGCHTQIFKQWNGSMHSKAWKDPIYRAALNNASKNTQGQVDKLCMGCHTPIGTLSGNASPSGKGMSEVADKGVSCEVCHNISDTKGIGNGAYILTPKLYGVPLKFGPFKDSKSPYHDTAYSALHTKSEFCGQCHNVTHPFNQTPIERTYDEWKDSVYASTGVNCQDCHMKPAPGMAAPMGKQRDKIFSHNFVGGNTSMPTLLGSEEHTRLARDMLKSAATIEIMSVDNLRPGQRATVIVKVSNVGAGHKLPTGFPEGREMWVDFKVSDAKGRMVYRLGAIKDGVTEPKTKSFKVTMADAKGNVVNDDVTKVARILYDSRILPKSYSEVEYTFDVPNSVEGTLTLSADLNYWSFSQHLADELLGKNKLQVPVEKIATTAMQVQGGAPVQGAHAVAPQIKTTFLDAR